MDELVWNNAEVNEVSEEKLVSLPVCETCVNLPWDLIRVFVPKCQRQTRVFERSAAEVMGDCR
jgi:hypothetical protein